MAIPVAAFRFAKEDITPPLDYRIVNFYDLSLNTPTSWQWDFGDGSPVVTTQNPQHTYASDGYYTVTMTATNADGSHTVVLTVGVSETLIDVSNVPLWHLINDYIPSALVDELTGDEKMSLITHWQRFIGPLIPCSLVDPSLEPPDLFNEFKYPPMVNHLIAQLVAYELVIQGANQMLSSAGRDSASDGSTDPDPTQNQLVKKIATGPSEVEWYDQSAGGERSDVMSAFSNAVKVGGAMDQLKNHICQLAARLRIHLDMCPALAYDPIPPEKYCPPTSTLYETVVSQG